MKEKISRTSPGYKQERTQIRDLFTASDEFHFGASVVELADELEKKSPSERAKAAELLRKAVADSKELLLKRLDPESPVALNAAGVFASGVYGLPASEQEVVLKALQVRSIKDLPLLNRRLNPRQMRYRITQVLRSRMVSDDTWIAMLREYHRTMERAEEAFAKLVKPQLQESFIARFKELIEENALPVGAGDIESTVAEIRTIPFDGLDPSNDDAREIGGLFHSDRGIAAFQTTYIVDFVASSGEAKRSAEHWLKYIYDHEFIHAFGGRTPLSYIARTEDEKRDLMATLPELDSQKLASVMPKGPFRLQSEDYRSGLQFLAARRGRRRFPWQVDKEFIATFHWLNEAVTEELALKMFPDAPNPGYENERKLFRFLLEGGKTDIDERVFYRAYFENYDPGRGTSSSRVGVPHWKAMWNAVEGAFGPGYLNRLDKIVQEKGVEYALEQTKAGAV